MRYLLRCTLAQKHHPRHISMEPSSLPLKRPRDSSDEDHPGKRGAAGWSKGKEKQSRHIGRRHRSPSDTPKNDQQRAQKPPRLPKRMTALLLGFCGTGCSGMQMCVSIRPVSAPPQIPGRYSQPDVRTIEGVLFDALVRAGAVSKDNADDPTKVIYPSALARRHTMCR